MKVIAIIQEAEEIYHLLRNPGCHAEQLMKAATRLVKQGRPFPGLDPASLN